MCQRVLGERAESNGAIWVLQFKLILPENGTEMNPILNHYF